MTMKVRATVTTGSDTDPEIEVRLVPLVCMGADSRMTVKGSVQAKEHPFITYNRPITYKKGRYRNDY